MTNYKRLISYMYEYENGIKRKNVGYVRIEVKNGQCKFTIHMQLPGQPDSVFPTYMIHRDSSGLDLVYLGDSLLKANMMDSRFIADEANIMDSGYNLKEMNGILIFMNDNIFFATLWDDYVLKPEELLQAMKADNQTSKSNQKKNEGKIVNRKPADIVAKPDSDESKEAIIGEGRKGTEDKVVLNDADDVKAADKSSDDITVDNRPYNELKAAFDLNNDKAVTDRTDEGVREDKDSKEALYESSQNQNKVCEDLQKADNNKKEEKRAECANMENEHREEDFYEEKLSLEEELKIPTYKFPRGLKTVEMFRRSMAVADKIDNADKDDRTNVLTDARQQKEASMKTAKESMAEVAGSDLGNREPNMREEKELKAADTGPARVVDGSTVDMDSIMARFNRLYPFEENEIVMCVKIEPKDIGLLPKEYWPLSSNSFLLHGYYCYHHLILAKMKYKDRAVYILGVPGLYQHREQFMARMFGFDCFKSIKKREPKKGDFGYWYLQLNF